MFRPFDPARDRDASHRIWREVGWHHDDDYTTMDGYVDAGRALVAEVDDAAECLVLSMPGTLRYLNAELPLACITGVTTSQVARGQGLATRLTARCVAEDAADGALVSLLGMFEQGFYNRLGFGSGSYERCFTFDPADLQLDRRARPPRRLTLADGEAIHAARLRTRRGHGAVTVTPLAHTVEEHLQGKDGFGFGYEADGELTHGLWLRASNREHGPYHVRFLFYRDGDDLLELLALLRSLGDQVRSVELREPPGVQLQDLLSTPLRRARLAGSGRWPSQGVCQAWWQLRLNNLAGCLAQTHLPGDPLRFNLVLTDPLADLLPADQPWRGVGGEYRVILANESVAWDGRDEHWPTLTASVGAFTRLWLGVRPATGLALTDDLSGPPELLGRLERRLRLPEPQPDWTF